MKAAAPADIKPDLLMSELEIMTAAGNYREWIYSQFSPYIGQRIIEVGSGMGNFTRLLLGKELVVALDDYEPCIHYLKKQFALNENVVIVKGDISSSKMLGLGTYNPDTIICTNVLEHIQADDVALAHMSTILGESGKLALLVPAFQSLYGSIDRLVGHHRRYEKQDLRRKLLAAGFTIHRLFYMNSLGALGWFVNNRILKRGSHNPSQVLFYDKFAVPLVRVIENMFKPPFGLSLVAIAEKTNK